ncbi:MAG TPA: metallophosphoesterase [Gammaproteobacteria bacterium]
MTQDIQTLLEKRLGVTHARQRLGIESEKGQQVFGKGFNFFHPENWYSTHSLIRHIIRLSGMYRRGRRNACNIQVRENTVSIAALPEQFEGFTLLHLSDLHVDMYDAATAALIKTIASLNYDLCVLTGDYRAKTYGEIAAAMDGMQRVTQAVKTPMYGVLGNHDSITMVPDLESYGVQMLLNESAPIECQGEIIHLCGVDDAHYFRVENIAKAEQNVPPDAVSVMLSHTPEIYREVAYAGFNLMLCGHTHGGQICLPGGIPVTLDSKCPRYMGKGAWRYRDMHGYTSAGSGTSIVDVRFNCLPEVTLHRLTCA